jgi:transglutaminase-like putative cysteine protease
MHLRVHHRTRYCYRAPVADSHNEVRLRPATEDPRRLSFYLLNVNPPVRLRHFRDDHYNYVQWFEIPEPHSELLIEATSIVHTTSQYAGGFRPAGVRFDDLRQSEGTDILRPFLTSSRYIALDHHLWRLAIDARQECQEVFETAEAIMHFVHAGWTYTPDATTASTHISEVLRTRRGVCQDFAHVMCGMCRSLGIPARYVSGYIYSGATSCLLGAQASHAWCEICLPELGWFGLDPTNAVLADERYVKIATGADYDDAAPIRGSYRGPAGATTRLEVAVEVELA